MNTYISTIMLLHDHGYNNFYLEDIEHDFLYKANIAKDRKVYRGSKYYYKIFTDLKTPRRIISNIATGFYAIASPQLVGIIFSDYIPVGYVSNMCSRAVNHIHLKNFVIVLQELFLRTGLVVYDIHVNNLGVYNHQTCFLDLDAVAPWQSNKRTRNIEYTNFIKAWA